MELSSTGLGFCSEQFRELEDDQSGFGYIKSEMANNIQVEERVEYISLEVKRDIFLQLDDKRILLQAGRLNVIARGANIQKE